MPHTRPKRSASTSLGLPCTCLSSQHGPSLVLAKPLLSPATYFLSFHLHPHVLAVHSPLFHEFGIDIVSSDQVRWSPSKGSLSKSFFAKSAVCRWPELPMFGRWPSSLGSHCNCYNSNLLHSTYFVASIPSSVSPSGAFQWHLCQPLQRQSPLVVFCGPPSSTDHRRCLHSSRQWRKRPSCHDPDLLLSQFPASSGETVCVEQGQYRRAMPPIVIDCHHSSEWSEYYLGTSRCYRNHLLFYPVPGPRFYDLGGCSAEEMVQKAEIPTRLCCACLGWGGWWNDAERPSACRSCAQPTGDPRVTWMEIIHAGDLMKDVRNTTPSFQPCIMPYALVCERWLVNWSGSTQTHHAMLIIFFLGSRIFVGDYADW